jgi:hypothetical protein
VTLVRIETSVLTRPTQRHIPVDGILHSHRHETSNFTSNRRLHFLPLLPVWVRKESKFVQYVTGESYGTAGFKRIEFEVGQFK